MKATMAYAAKRAVRTALVAQTGTGQPLEGWQVAYSYPARDITRKVIYLGGVRSTRTELSEEQNLVAAEQVTVGLYLRVLRPDADVEAADANVETAADAIAALFEAQPHLGGNMTWLGVITGNGDYSESPDGPESVLSLQILVGAVLI